MAYQNVCEHGLVRRSCERSYERSYERSVLERFYSAEGELTSRKRIRRLDWVKLECRFF